MQTITSYNIGNSFCNLIANKIIETFNNINSEHNSRIKVSDHGKFIILNGFTSLESSINFSSIINTYVVSLGIDRTLNFIDLIEYKKQVENNKLFRRVYSYEYNPIISEIYGQIKEFDTFDIEIDTKRRILFCNENDIVNHLSKTLQSYSYFENNISLPHISDDFYGLSLNLEKIYQFYFKYIAHNLFEKQLCKNITFDITIDPNEEINHDTIKFEIYSSNKMTSISWLKSMILDLFDMNPEVIIEKFNLRREDLEYQIKNEDQKLWCVRDMTQEMILF